MTDNATMQVQINAAVNELKQQRDALGDRATNLAVQLAQTQLTCKQLESKVSTLEEALEKYESDDVEETDASKEGVKDEET